MNREKPVSNSEAVASLCFLTGGRRGWWFFTMHLSEMEQACCRRFDLDNEQLNNWILARGLQYSLCLEACY